MTASEKSELYTMLAAADGWLSGYRDAGTEPCFTDSPDLPDVDTPDEGSCPSPSFGSLEAVAEAVSSCARCPLASGRTRSVPGEGPAGTDRVPVMVIGEGPGADEDASGRPFVGKAGQLLDRMLAAIQLSRTENCFIANIVKCRPPQNREPSPGEAASCIPYLEAQIALVRPRLILALGRTAAQNLLKTGDGINHLRGHWYEYRGIPVLPTYHPSALLRDETLKRPAWEDLKAFRTELDRLLAGEN